MIEADINEIIVGLVLRNIPRNIKPVVYLMELLGLSRESIYRRMRKEIPFSIEEITKLSLTLGFSIDEIIEGCKKERMFFDLQIPTNFSDTYIWLFQTYNAYVQILQNVKNSTVLMSLNHLPPLFAGFHDNLFKFFYYKWLTENMEDISRYFFSELVIPPELAVLRKKLFSSLKDMGSVTIIFSPHIYLSTIKDIQYFYRRKLLTDEDLALLNKDILDLVDLTEKVAQTGIFNSNIHIDFYLSQLHIHSDTMYLQYGDVKETHYWIYTANPMIVRNSEICGMQKKWFQSLKKQSTFITQSNEILQTEFFDMQREYVKKFLGENARKDFTII
jgi:hypothetical protein